jgi:cysteinyl-tRNA synthetase, unknown class
MQKKLVLFSFFLILLLVACTNKPIEKPDYRAEMRRFVQKIDERGEQLKPGFIVVPQNGLALITQDGKADGIADQTYLNVIDGIGQEELFYGYDNQDDQITPDPEHSEWLSLAERLRDEGKKMLVIDYVISADHIADSYQQNYSRGFISFAATSRELDIVPTVQPYVIDTNDIVTLQDAQNFLYIISTGNFQSKEEMLRALEQSPHDVIVMDLFFDQGQAFDSTDLARLRHKPQGGIRQLICYMSIGQAESYRWYWKPWWNASPPDFILQEDQNWVDNYYVKYWDQNWQDVICGPNDSYLNEVIEAGFDGVYLDLVNAYEYFEE